MNTTTPLEVTLGWFTSLVRALKVPEGKGTAARLVSTIRCAPAHTPEDPTGWDRFRGGRDCVTLRVSLEWEGVGMRVWVSVHDLRGGPRRIITLYCGDWNDPDAGGQECKTLEDLTAAILKIIEGD